MGRRAFGTVRKLPSGRWQARYRLPDGQLVSASTTFATKAEATRHLATIETDLARDEWQDPRSGPTLSEYSERWLSTRTVKGRPLAPRTRDTYRNSLDRWIVPLLGDRHLHELTPAVVRVWHADVSGQTGPTAVRQAYALLRAILNTAVDDEVLRRNPCRLRGAGQSTSPERPLLTAEQVAKVRLAMPEHLRCLVTVAFWAHTRLGEALALQRGDVDVSAGTLRVERQQVEVVGKGAVVTEPKMASRRLVHLPEPALEAVRQHLKERGPLLPTAPLFTQPDGAPLRAWHVQWAWRKARQRAGLGTVHFHDLRHAGLTLTAQSGATLAEVMRRAGHASSAAAMRYQHAADRRDAQIAARMSEVARAQSGDAG